VSCGKKKKGVKVQIICANNKMRTGFNHFPKISKTPIKHSAVSAAVGVLHQQLSRWCMYAGEEHLRELKIAVT